MVHVTNWYTTSRGLDAIPHACGVAIPVYIRVHASVEVEILTALYHKEQSAKTDHHKEEAISQAVGLHDYTMHSTY